MSRPFRYEWDGTVRRLRLRPNVKLIAAYTSQYADNEGRNARPGVERLSLETGLGTATVKRCLKELRDLGLLVLTRSGSAEGRRGKANEYKLAIPEDILDKVALVTAVDISPLHPNGNTDHLVIPDNDPEQGSPSDPGYDEPAEEQGSLGDPCYGGTGIKSGSEQGSPSDPPPTRDHASINNTPESEDLGGSVTGPRVRAGPQDPISRCPHGLSARDRPDGEPECALCRLGYANVVSIHRRRSA